MIAVWLVGPPRSVTRPTTTDGCSPAVSEGARSSATRMDGLGRRGYAGLRLAHEAGDDPALDVAQVGDPLGHQPAHAGEDVGELVDGGVHGAEQVVARAERLADRAAQALVAG